MGVICGLGDTLSLINRTLTDPCTHPFTYDSPTDFDGDGKPDVVVGFLGGFTIYYLQDDPDQPIASYTTVHAPTDVALSGGFVAFQNMSAPFTQWPCDIVRTRACVCVSVSTYPCACPCMCVSV